MYDNTIISKYEMTDKDKEMKNKFFESKPSSKSSTLIQNQEANNPFLKNLASSNLSKFSEHSKNPILKQTQSSINELYQYKSNFENTKKSNEDKIDEVEVHKILSPVYDKVDEIKKEIKKINENISDTKDKNNNNPKIDDEIFKAHQYLERNKNNIGDTLLYMKENISNINNEKIGNDIDELTSILNNLNNEMENMTNNFNEKFELVIKEKRREKIAEDLLSGKYKDSVNVSKYFPNENMYVPSNALNKIDYNEYKNDLNDIIYEKDNLMLRYEREREEAVKDFTQLMKPKEKTNFNYDILDASYKDSLHKSKISKKNKKINQTQSKRTKQKFDGSKITNQNYQNDNIDNNDKLNEPTSTKSKLTPSEKMLKYREQMNDLSSRITAEKSRQTKDKKVIHIGPTKQDIIRTMQPRSLNSKRTLQDFQRKKLEPIYEREEEKKEPNPFRAGKYPTEEEKKLKVNYYEQKKRKIYPDYKDITNIKINIPDNIKDDNINDEIRRNIELYIRRAIRENKQKRKEDKVKIDIEEKNNIINPDLMKLLIQKFDELQNTILGSGFGNYNNNNINFGGININDYIADQVINRMGLDLDVNIDKEQSISRHDIPDIIESQEKKIKISERRKREIEREKEEGKKIEVDDGKRIPLFESNDKISIEELDKIIQMPHKINLSDYNVSSSSSYLSESLNQRNLKEMIEYHERNIFSKEEESDNSISRGQAISEDNEYSDSLHKGNDGLNIRNRTGLDLLMVKNFNERLPEQIIGNNDLSNSDDNDDNDEESESFNQDNKNIVDIDNKSRLKQYNLYESEEFNKFKNNFMNQLNKNNNNQ